ncbi:Mu-like prophage major head subunit gpT family protein [Pleomorphomonas koreensis]|uniref:Mu-like prophage major head subunit gpT family protein n=1 Tax=Pleomorphomonas koreensis TaxID=257440 RepID=UPI00040FCDAC|nr:Mu-like prophage major head subunit gpT family protein [Pleomorphomonas koreensis]
MEVNAANLNSLRVGYSAAYQRGLGQAPSQYPRVSTIVPASQKEQKYGWLGKIAKVREWIGPRLVRSMEQHDYSIKEKKWELTQAVDRDDIETDNLGIYGPMFEEMGMSTQSLPDELVFGLLKDGFSTVCYDGQNFFDTDHPVLDKDGNETSVANTDGGSSTPWFLLCTNRPLKPIILQRRKDFQFVAKDNPDDDNVFNNNEFVYGADARMNVGFGFWQFAWGSKQTLDATHYETARGAISGMKGDHGRPLGLMPNLLVVPPSLEGAGRALLQSQLVNGGESNKWAGTAELLVVPWLA